MLFHTKHILLFTPDSYERESKNTHQYTDEGYYQLIKHEISHTIVRDIAKNMCPRWLNEGLAIYSSEQILSKRKPESFNVFLIVTNFLKTLEDINTEKTFRNQFENYFKINLSYDWFNNRWEKGT